MSNLWARLARLRVDVSPLRDSRDFRLLFWAGTVFYLGGMVSYVALPYQLHQLTGSNFAVGALGIVELAPLVVFGLYGGALADHVDRRLMLVVTGGAQVLLTAAIALSSLGREISGLAGPALGGLLLQWVGHRGHVHGDADRALPCADNHGLPCTGDARTALLG